MLIHTNGLVPQAPARVYEHLQQDQRRDLRQQRRCATEHTFTSSHTRTPAVCQRRHCPVDEAGTRARATPGAAILVVSPPHERRTIAAVLRIGSGARAWGGGGCTVATDGSWARTPIAADARSRTSTKEDPAPDERDAADLLKSLTPQQARILELVCEGKFNKQIAYSLDISEGTVKAHLTAILRKLKVQSRTQAVVIAQNARFTATARDMRGGAPARRG